MICYKFIPTDCYALILSFSDASCSWDMGKNLAATPFV